MPRVKWFGNVQASFPSNDPQKKIFFSNKQTFKNRLRNPLNHNDFRLFPLLVGLSRKQLIIVC